jgi:pyruvate-formate lyase-activating enzyme
VALQTQYIFDRFGKFPGTVPSVVATIYLQAHHLDLEFYDAFYKPGAYLRIGETDIRSAVDSGEWGFVHSFQTGSGVDGPGVRIVAWLSGCQFRCVFCHNPDTWKLTNGMPVPLSRAVEVVGQYRHSLRTMKGGLTISGGEPLIQHRFVLKLSAAVQKLGVHTAIETNGCFGERLSDDDLASIDLVMLGLKAITPELHREITGMDHKPVHKFARRLAARKRPVWIRFVIVPGFTDDMKSGAWRTSPQSSATSSEWTCCRSINSVAINARNSEWTTSCGMLNRLRRRRLTRFSPGSGRQD